MKHSYLFFIIFINYYSCRTQDINRINLMESGENIAQVENKDKKIGDYNLPDIMDNNKKKLEIEAAIAFIKEGDEQKPIATLQVSASNNQTNESKSKSKSKSKSNSNSNSNSNSDSDSDSDNDSKSENDSEDKGVTQLEGMLAAGGTGVAKKIAIEYKKYIVHTNFSSHIDDLKHDKEIIDSTDIDSKDINFSERKIISENNTSMLLIVKDKDGNRHLCKMYNDGNSIPFYTALLEILGIKKTIKKSILAQKKQLMQHDRYSSFETSGKGYIIKSFHSEEYTLLDLLNIKDNNKITTQQEQDLFKLVEDLITPDKNGKYLALGDVTPGNIVWNPEKKKWIVLDSMPYKVFASKKAALKYTIENITNFSSSKSSKDFKLQNKANELKLKLKQRKNITPDPFITKKNYTIKSFAAAGAAAGIMPALKSVLGLTSTKYSCVIQDTLCFEFNLSSQSNIDIINKWCEQLYTYLPNAKDVYIQEGKDCSENFKPCESLINDKLLFTVHISKEESTSICEHLNNFQEQQKIAP